MTPPAPVRTFSAVLPFPPQLTGAETARQHLLGFSQLNRPLATAPNGSLEIVKVILPRIGISTRTLKRLEAIQLVREQRDAGTQEISYHARPFVLCGLPIRQPPTNQLVYSRRNGHFLLEITAHPGFGLPYGQDRLIPIWLATLAHKQRSRTVHFSSPSELLDYFHLPKHGAQYRRIRAAFQRIFAATIFFGTEQEMKQKILVDSARFHFMDSVRLWFNRSGTPESPQAEASGYSITLSEEFYREMSAHPIPVEREVIAALAHAPGLLDFYVWIAWKSWTVNERPARVPILGASGLCCQLGTAEYSVDGLFRHKIRHWLAHVKILWPECSADISGDGRFLLVRSSRRTAAVRPVERQVLA